MPTYHYGLGEICFGNYDRPQFSQESDDDSILGSGAEGFGDIADGAVVSLDVELVLERNRQPSRR